MASKIVIFVAQHFPCELPQCFADCDIYKPIQCGRALSEPIPGAVGDDTGDNISCSNPDVNEMTAIYWAGTHLDEFGNPEYVGFCHYRRCLEWNFSDLKEKQVVVHRWFSWRTLKDQFGCCHRIGDLDKFIDRMKLVMPDDEKRDFEVYWRSHFLYLANCFIMPRAEFTRYSEFMRQCLSVVFGMIRDNCIDRSGYDASMKRVYGFMLERMTGYWIWRERRYGRIRLRFTKMLHYDIANGHNGTRQQSLGLWSILTQAQ